MSAPIRVDSPETPKLPADVEAALMTELDTVLARLGINLYDRAVIKEKVVGYATAERTRQYSINQQRERGISARQLPFSGQG